jgi:hypothetical protein
MMIWIGDAYQDDLQDAEEDVIEAQQDVADAQTDLQDYLNLDEDNSTRQRYEDDLKDAQDAYHEKVRAKSEIQFGTRPCRKHLPAG